MTVTPESDDLIRLGTIMLLKSSDEAIPDDLPDDIGAPPTRASSLAYKSVSGKEISQFDYHAVVTDECVVPIKIKRMSRSDDRGRNSSIWERGHKLHPQILQAYAKDETILNLVVTNSELTGDKTHFEAGDGAPIDQFFKLQRVGLALQRKETNSEAEENVEGLMGDYHIDETLDETEASVPGYSEDDVISVLSSNDSDDSLNGSLDENIDRSPKSN